MRLRALCVLLALWASPASAQIAFGTIGASSTGTTSVTVLAPASISAGDLLVICMGTREAPTTPSGDGWTLVATQSGGSGAEAANSGTVISTVYVKQAVGGDTDQVVAISGGTSSVGRMARYTKTAATWAATTASKGADSTPDTTWIVVGDADQGVASGDMVVACSAMNTQIPTASAELITQLGVTYTTNTERAETSTAAGFDVMSFVSDHTVTAGASAGVPTFTATISTTSGSYPAGATVMARIREAAAGGACRGTLLGVGCE